MTKTIRPTFSFRHPGIDLVAGALLLAAANALWHRQSMGWTDANPSPWLLLPVLIGGRWGWGWGVISGLVAAGVGIGGETFAGHRLKELFPDRNWFFLSFPLLGFLSGEVSRLVNTRASKAEATVAELSAEKASLTAESEALAQSKHELQQRLALVGADSCSLDQQLRALFSPGAPDLFTGLLRLLRDACGVQEAAFYRVERDGHLEREALLGLDDRLPNKVRREEWEAVGLALEKDDLITARSLWKSGAPDQNGTGRQALMAVMPFHGADGETYLLAVRRMKFTAVSWRTFSRMQLISGWTSLMAQHKADGQGPVRREGGFNEHLAFAQQAATEHRLPSAKVSFLGLGGITFEELSASIAGLLPPTATATRETTGGVSACLKVLLPLEGQREAESLAQRILAALPGRVDAAIELIDTPAHA